MPARERRKGRDGEAEVAEIWEAAGFTVRGLESGGDHLVRLGMERRLVVRGTLDIHSEVKRCETARVWAWVAQAESEAPPGSVPVVSFRRNRSPWYSIIRTAELARLLA